MPADLPLDITARTVRVRCRRLRPTSCRRSRRTAARSIHPPPRIPARIGRRSLRRVITLTFLLIPAKMACIIKKRIPPLPLRVLGTLLCLLIWSSSVYPSHLTLSFCLEPGTLKPGPCNDPVDSTFVGQVSILVTLYFEFMASDNTSSFTLGHYTGLVGQLNENLNTRSD